MRFAIQQSTLLRVLQQVVNAVERKQVMQILGNILVEAREGSLRFTGGDNEIEVTTELELDEIYAEGATTLPARKLFDVVKSLSEDCVLEFVKEASHCQVLAGPSRFALATRDPSEYPKLENLEAPFGCTFDSQKKLKRMLERTSFSMGIQDVRTFLNGLMLEFDESGAVAVATDGHRMSLNRQEISDWSGEDPKQIILPRKAVTELSRLLGGSDMPVTVRFGTSHLIVQIDKLTFTTKLINARFPDYQKVIPKNLEISCVIQVEFLRQALARSAIMANDRYKGVRFALEQSKLTLLARNQEQEESRDEMAVDYSGDPLTVSFNIGYLLDILGSVDDEWVRITFANLNSSALVEEVSANDSLYVVMPMKV